MLLAPLYYVLFFVTLLVPGYVAIKKLGYFKQSPGAELALGYSMSIVFYALLATVAYAAKVSLLLTRIITIAIIVITLIELVRAGYYRDLWKLRFSLFAVAALSILATLFVSLTLAKPYGPLPDPQPDSRSNYSAFDVKILNLAHTQANDNSIPYRQAQFFLNRSDPAKAPFISEWSVTFFVRTPLMGAVTANYLNLLAEKPPTDLIWRKSAPDPKNTYLQFQILAHILNSLFLLPAFFLLSRLLSKKTGLISCLFMVINPFFLYDAFFSWPKSLVAFFILTGWLLLCERKRAYTIAASMVFGAAYLTHDLAILYLGATALYLLISRRFKDLVWIAATPFLCALAWLLIATKRYHETSGFVYYPISTEGIPQPSQYPALLQKFLHTPPLKLVSIRLGNIFYLLTPNQLFSRHLFHALVPSFWAVSIYSIPGALGLGLLPVVFLAAFKRLVNLRFWVLAIGPVLFEALFMGWPKALGALHFAEASVALLTGLSVAFLIGRKRSIWLFAAYTASLLGFFIFVAFSYHYAIDTWIHNIRDILSIACMLVITGGAGWALYSIRHNKKIAWLYP